jgi:hypothetical protein
MRLPWRTRLQTAESLEENPPEDTGPRILTHQSPGLELALGEASNRETCWVLDLGPSVPENLAVVAAFASRVHIVDATGSWLSERAATLTEPDGRIDDLQALCPEFEASFNLILTWDVFNYLTPRRAEALMRVIARLSRADAHLHAIVHCTDTMPAVPARYRIVDQKFLAYEPVTAEVQGTPDLPPAEVEKLLAGFRVEHSFVLRHGVREYVAVRER